MEIFSESLVDWSRAQFALTAIYHWFFVPLTLGLSFMIAFMHTIYVKTDNDFWMKTTKFWMKIFGINFAIGVATGIILEFEFGTNWSNYSWFVGDIFGAPLAVEGIMAFFLESTFIAIMFFGWGRVSKKFHLVSSWMVAFGSNLSALWILVANGWMQHPIGMRFNPDTARNEMENFFDVLFSPTAVNKFLHTISNGYVVSALFVIGVCSWYLLKGRHLKFAKRSILFAAVFGLLSSLFLVFTGDGSAYQVAQTQPMKLAAMEGLYQGEKEAGLVAIGILNHDKEIGDNQEDYAFAIKIPGLLSYLAMRDMDAFVPGVNDLVNGNKAENIPSTQERMESGKKSINALAKYKEFKDSDNTDSADYYLSVFESNFDNFGYGFLKNKEHVVPNVPITFYSFHIMVSLGFFFVLLFLVMLYFILKENRDHPRWLLHVGVWSIPLGYIASQMGWIVSEVGRQPWTIQDLLTTNVSTSHISTGTVQTTFWLFAALFTVLLIVEIKILVNQIKLGPKEERS